jgi:hypothetical protein
VFYLAVVRQSRHHLGNMLLETTCTDTYDDEYFDRQISACQGNSGELRCIAGKMMTCTVTILGMPEFDGNRFVEVYAGWVPQYLGENVTYCPPKLPIAVAVASCYFAGSVFSSNVAGTVSPSNFSSKPSEYLLPTTCTIFFSNFTVSVSFINFAKPIRICTDVDFARVVFSRNFDDTVSFMNFV